MEGNEILVSMKLTVRKQNTQRKIITPAVSRCGRNPAWEPDVFLEDAHSSGFTPAAINSSAMIRWLAVSKIRQTPSAFFPFLTSRALSFLRSSDFLRVVEKQKLTREDFLPVWGGQLCPCQSQHGHQIHIPILGSNMHGPRS